MQIYLYINEQQVGPYTPDQLQQLLAAGQIPAETPAWYEGLPEWSTVSSVVPSVSAQTEAPVVVPPPPPIATAAPDVNVNCLNRRVFGGIIDMCILPIIIIPLLLGIEIVSPNFFPDGRGEAIFGWLLCAPVVAYFISSPFQATPGMMLLGLIATNQQGLRIGYGRAFLRHVVSFFSFFLFIGFLLWNFNKKRQTLHDMVSGTIVVRKPAGFHAGRSPWIPIAAMAIPSILLTVGLLAFTNVGQSLSDESSDTHPASQASQSTASATAPDQTQNNPAQAQNVAPAADTTAAQATSTPDAQQSTDDDLVTEVKGGTLDFDDSVKIGPALEGSSFLKNVSWKSFKTPQGRQVVEANATVNLEAYKNSNLDASGTKLPPEWVDGALKNAPSLQLTYTVQFQISQADDKSISVAYSGYTMSAQNAGTGQTSEKEMKDDDDLRILKSIFANQPDLPISNLLAALSQQKTTTVTPTSATTTVPPQ